MALLNVVGFTLLFCVAQCYGCSICSCCQSQVNTWLMNHPSVSPTCYQVQDYCTYKIGCTCATYVVFELEKESTSASNDRLSTGEIGLISVAAVLAVGVFAAVGVIALRSDSEQADEAIEMDELNDNLIPDSKNKRPTRKADGSRILTTMTALSCIVAVVALVIAVVAFTDKRTSQPSSSSNTNSDLQVMPSYADQYQLRSGPYKVHTSALVSSHPFCKQNLSYWKACAQLQDDVSHLISAVGRAQRTVAATSQVVTEGNAGERTFVASHGKFIAVSPALTRLGSKLNQTHPLADTRVCSTYTSFSVDVCVVQHTSVDMNHSVLVAYIHPNPNASTTARRSRRNSYGGVESQLSDNWQGSYQGAEQSAETGAIHGAESGAWHGAVTGAIAGIAGGPAGVVGGAITGGIEGAAKGAVEGAIKGGLHYVGDEALNDAETTYDQDY